MYKTTNGNAERTTTAITTGTLRAYWSVEANLYIPNGRTVSLLDCVIIRGKRKVFHAPKPA